MGINSARILRKNQTSYETKLWQALRNRQLNSLKFRRQHVIGNYIVDFCCLSKRLIIEIDGGQHNEKNNIIEDNIRTKYLQDQDFRVLRFWNNEVRDNFAGVIEKIIETCNDYPSPRPLPKGEG
jgi:adenine-specific DNA-methyltransferase